MKMPKLLFLPLLAVCLAQANDLSDIRAVHDNFSKAALANNVNRMVKVAEESTTPDFELKEKNGTVSRAQWLQIIRNQMGAVKVTSWVFSHKDLKVRGDMATMVTTLRVSAQIKDPKTGKVSKLDSTSVSKETMAKLAGKWKIKRLESISDRVAIDGKVVSPR